MCGHRPNVGPLPHSDMQYAKPIPYAFLPRLRLEAAI